MGSSPAQLASLCPGQGSGQVPCAVELGAAGVGAGTRFSWRPHLVPPQLCGVHRQLGVPTLRGAPAWHGGFGRGALPPVLSSPPLQEAEFFLNGMLCSWFRKLQGSGGFSPLCLIFHCKSFVHVEKCWQIAAQSTDLKSEVLKAKSLTVLM